jgi:hypothetical protein
MKKTTLLLLFASISTILFAQKSETRKVDDFSYISFGINGDLTIIQGNKNEVILEGDPEDLEKIETVVSGSKLRIKTEGGSWSWWDNMGKIKATVTLKEFTGLSVSGSGKAASEGSLRGDNIDLGVSGSGNIELNLEANDIDCGISGSGSIYLNGSGKTGSLSISGSGKLDAVDYEIETISISISGSGDASVFATKEIDSRISGSGTVRYKGDPDKISNRASGSGKLKKM